MTEPDDDVQAKRLDRVRKLLAKAERAGTPEEAETYTARAVELMTEHGIDETMARAADPGAAADPIDATIITIADPYSGPKARLLGWTASALGCRWVMHNARQGRVPAVSIFGHASDRQRAELLYTSLLLQIAVPLRTLRDPRDPWHDPGAPKWAHDSRSAVAAYRRSWLYGYAQRIHDRLVAAQAAAARRHDDARARAGQAPAGGGAELVLANRASIVDRAHSAYFGKLSTARSPSFSGGGYGEGVRAADRADLGTTGQVGGARQRALPTS